MMYQLGEAAPTRLARSDPRRWLALALLGAAFLVTMLDGTIVYTALPSIGRELDFPVGDVQWVMSAYLLGFGGLLLLGARLADRFGRHRMFVVGTALFTIGSLVAGIAGAAGVLVAGRAVQGIGAAMLAPTTLPLLAAAFGEGLERGRALGVWTAIGALGGTAGLVIGGPITDGPGWQWIFLLNVPIGVILLAASPTLPRERLDTAGRPTLDLAGAVTLTLALTLLVFAVSGAARAGWASLDTAGSLLASAVVFAAFVIVERRAREPLVPVRGLASGTLLGSMLVLVAAGMALDGTLFLLTAYMQDVLEFSATTFGLLLTVMTLSSVAGSFAGQVLVVRRGFRLVAAAGSVLVGIGMLLLTAVSVDGSFVADVFLGILVFGPGLGAAFVAAQIALVSGFPEAESVRAAGLADASFSIGGALGLAVLSTVVVARAGAALPDTDQLVSPAALTSGVSAGFAVAAGFAAVGLASALVLLRQPKAARVRRLTR